MSVGSSSRFHVNMYITCSNKIAGFENLDLHHDTDRSYNYLQNSHMLSITDWREVQQTRAVPTWAKVAVREGASSCWSHPDSQSSGSPRSIKELIRKYDLELTASTFLIVDADQASLEIACQWQRCMGGQVSFKNTPKVPEILLIEPPCNPTPTIPGHLSFWVVKLRYQPKSQRSKFLSLFRWQRPFQTLTSSSVFFPVFLVLTLVNLACFFPGVRQGPGLWSLVQSRLKCIFFKLKSLFLYSIKNVRCSPKKTLLLKPGPSAYS